MNKKQHIYLLILLITLYFSSCSVSGHLKQADKKYAIGEYYTASIMYKRVLRRIPTSDKYTRGEVCFKMANCYRLFGNAMQADPNFSKAIRFNVEDSTANLYYADVLMKLKRTKEARTFFNNYLELDPNSTWAKNGILACDSVKEWRSKVSPYKVTKLDALNSRKTAEFSPAVADEDGNVLYFTSSRPNPETSAKISKITGLRNNDIYLAKRNLKGKWDTPVALNASVNGDGDEGACCVSVDGSTMYFTRCRTSAGKALGAEIYVSKRSGGEWSEAQYVKLVNDSSITVAHPAISPDNKYLYFVSDLEGGFGGKDIWRSERISETEWGTPENLGKDINTNGDEMFPAFKANGTFYFSSNGWPGHGGLDIFKTTLIQVKGMPDKWLIENLHEPMNSSGDDFGITFQGSKDKGYFSSNRNEPKGYDKLYAFEIPILELILEGKVVDDKDQPIESAIVRVIGDDGTNTKVRVRKDGAYRLKLDKNVRYIMQASARGYLNEKANQETFYITKSETFKKNFKLASLGKPVIVDNIFYEFGKWELNESSKTALTSIVKMLNDNPNITIELRAHTDMVGSPEQNLELSSKRAESVVYFLIKSGIDANRLTAKGFGETTPVVADEELAKKYNFLKVGDVLNEDYIKALSNKQQEICNTINRRTEFVVVKTTYNLYK